MSEWREKIKTARTFEEYVKLYEEMWEHTVDMSPVGLERSTERRMINELKTMVERGFHRLALSDRENKILGFLSSREKWINLTIKRNSDIEFDISVGGEKGVELIYKFSIWMPLAIIAAADWTDPKIWSLSDGYGKKGYIPAQGIDWSGIRDSTSDAVLEMMKVALEKIEIEISKEAGAER